MSRLRIGFDCGLKWLPSLVRAVHLQTIAAMETARSSSLDQLLKAARGGDRAAFAVLIERFHPLLSEHAADELGSTLHAKVAASDLVQESLLEAYRDFQNFRGTTVSEFRSWLKRILQRSAVDLGRQFRAECRDVARERPHALQAADAPCPSPGASTIAQDREALERVADCLVGLTEEERTIVLLRYRDELGFEEIAGKLGWSREKVRRAWYSAIETIGRQAGECK
jgi:RNA polymerase sigma-70 factor (ECF subfamily)